MKNDSRIAFDAALLLALQRDAEQEIMALPKPAELKQQYPDTEKWDLRLKNALNRRKRRVWKNVFAMAAVVAMLFAGALAVNADFRKATYKMIRNFKKEMLEIVYQVESETMENLPDGYGEQYIPDGFELVDSYEDPRAVVHTYKDEESGRNCIVVYEVIQEAGQLFTFGTKNSDYSVEWRNGMEFLQEEYEEDGYRSYTLFWESSGIAHTVMGEMEIDELYRIAESICAP